MDELINSTDELIDALEDQTKAIRDLKNTLDEYVENLVRNGGEL